jgi:hypothetical protein
MLAPTADAFLGLEGAQSRIVALASLYDQAVNSLDPYDSRSDKAEEEFERNICEWHDQLPALPDKPSLREFRRAVIRRCRSHIKATERRSCP